MKDKIKEIEEESKIIFEKQLDKIAYTSNSVLLDKIYLVPREYIRMVINKKVKGLLLWGECGNGKTFQVKKAIKEYKLKEGIDYNFITGHITPLQFYKKLYENRNSLIIIDDISIFDSKININMLKASLNDNCQLVEYNSSLLKDFPNSFIFNGRIIILLNEKLSNNEDLKAVESRILTYNLKMDYKTKINIINDIAKEEYDGLNLNERLEIVEWIEENSDESTKNLSIRLLFMCFEFYKWNKELWKELAGNYVRKDEYVSLII